MGCRSIFTNSGKCNEVLKRTEQSRKGKRELNSLLWSKYILVDTKKQIFYTVVESILSYSWEM
jgi:hypothetical protein